MNNREMYYGYTPINSFMGMPSDNNFTNSIINDMKMRIERLERQIKRIDQRLMRLEAPYANNNEPDNDMYIM